MNHMKEKAQYLTTAAVAGQESLHIRDPLQMACTLVMITDPLDLHLAEGLTLLSLSLIELDLRAKESQIHNCQMLLRGRAVNLENFRAR